MKNKILNLYFGGEKITSKRINNIKTLFDEYGPIIKAAILRENKVCSRDIKELMDKGRYVIFYSYFIFD